MKLALSAEKSTEQGVVEMDISKEEFETIKRMGYDEGVADACHVLGTLGAGFFEVVKALADFCSHVKTTWDEMVEALNKCRLPPRKRVKPTRIPFPRRQAVPRIPSTPYRKIIPTARSRL